MKREIRDLTLAFEQLSIVNVETKTVDRKPMSADSAIINPSDDIIALKSARSLQVFNFVTKTKLKVCLGEIFFLLFATIASGRTNFFALF